jgi:hypothetical protein
MAPGSDRNSYYAHDASAAASWDMSFYDYPGSLNVPVVDPINPINEYVTYPHVTHIHILLLKNADTNCIYSAALGADGMDCTARLLEQRQER